MRYRISRLRSGFEFVNLTTEEAQIIYDGTIITHYTDNPVAAIFGSQSHLKVSEKTADAELIQAIENEVLPIAAEEIQEEVPA